MHVHCTEARNTIGTISSPICEISRQARSYKKRTCRSSPLPPPSKKLNPLKPWTPSSLLNVISRLPPFLPSLLHLVSPHVAGARAQMCQLCRLPAFLQLALHTHSPVPAPDVVPNPRNNVVIVLRGGGGVSCKLCSKVGHFARVCCRREVSHKTTTNASRANVPAADSVPPQSSLFLGSVYSPPDITLTVSSTVPITDVTALWHAILCVNVKPIPFKNELPHSACQAHRRFDQRFPFHIELGLEQHDTHSPLASICG